MKDVNVVFAVGIVGV